MAPAPFKVTLKAVGQDGWNNFYSCTVSDVNAAFYIFEDGQNVLTLPTNHGVIKFTDIILTAAGTDTTTATLYVNGKTVGVTVLNAANLGTNYSRQISRETPLAFAPGANIRFTQNT